MERQITLCLQLPFVSVVDDASSAESFFLEDKRFVQVTAVILGGCTEVEILVVMASHSKQLVEDSIENVTLFAFFRGGNVLRMRHLRCDI